ncbi:MAG TPA: hypothetical protein VFJ15_07170 [Oleiagrimonas sp.]|nr:hypothetical protein [Oleiagrimonas sp.]
MNKSLRLIALTVLVALATTLAACGGQEQDIHFDGHSVTLHTSGEPAATITSRGSLSVGSEAVDVTPAQRQLLLRYYNRVTGIHDDAEALKQAGFDLAGKAVHKAGHSIKQAVGLASGASTVDTSDLDAAGDKMQQRAHALCSEVRKAMTLQATLGKAIKAFAPYADIDPAPQVMCTGAVIVG